MLIGELAQRAGTTSRTLRYYETHGLLQAGRAANGYRTYDEWSYGTSGRSDLVGGRSD